MSKTDRLKFHLKFTQDAVERLLPPTFGRVTYYDSLLPGFGLRVSAPRPRSGHVCKTWIAFYRVNGKLVMETIGAMSLYPSLEKARDLARESMRKAQVGINLALERRAAKHNNRRHQVPVPASTKDPTRLVPAVVDKYMTAYRNGEGGKKRRKGTIANVQRSLDALKTWQPWKLVGDVRVDDGDNWSTMTLNELTRDAIRDYHKKFGSDHGESASNHSLTVTKAFFQWASDENIITANPIADLKRLFGQESRNRYLLDEEIRAFWHACNQLNYPYGPLCQLLLLTACRRAEVAQMPVKGELERNKKLWTLPPERTKSNREFVVPLTDMMLAIINRLPTFADSEFVFTAAQGGAAIDFRAAKTRLDGLMLAHMIREGHIAKGGELKHWTLHDLRRTARTNFGRLEIDDNIAERLLNHAIPGVRGVYDKWKYLKQKTEGLEKWCALVKTIIS